MSPRVLIEPQMHGGGQEREIRSGTLPTALVVGFAKSCYVAGKEMNSYNKRIMALRKRLIDGIQRRIGGVIANGNLERSYPGILNISFADVEGDSFLVGLKEIAMSRGNACTSTSFEPSYVLRAMGVDDGIIGSSIRYGIGKFTTMEEIDRVTRLTVHQIKKLRKMSPPL